jgi:raffinose/stachyose/melibiose transport system permease protein
MLMITIWSFLVFDYVYIITKGGPAHYSEVLATMVFNHAFGVRGGLCRAIGVSMSQICGSVVLIFVMLRRRGWDI